MPGMTLPPGFRFHPTDEELVAYYLKKRVKGSTIDFNVIADVDLYKCEPWDLPSKSRLPAIDLEWFFFSPRDRKYPNGSRTNRATEAGYWKATGRDRFVKTGAKTIGMKKTLVFYRGRAPHGERTDWLMHEYRLDGEEWENMNMSQVSQGQDAFVLCRVFKKNGLGPAADRTGQGSGLIEDTLDEAGSPEDIKPSVFMEEEVKPSLILPPLPEAYEGVTPAKGGPVVASVPAAESVTVDNYLPNNDPSISGVYNTQFLPDDDSFNKMKEMDANFWDGMDDSSWWEEISGPEAVVAQGCLSVTNLPALEDTESIDTVRADFVKSWQQENTGGAAANLRGENLWNGPALKYEDPTPLQPYHVLPMLGNEDITELDFLPSLTEDYSASPPTVDPTVDDSDSTASTAFASIMIRPRIMKIAPTDLGTGGLSSRWTASRRILCQRRSDGVRDSNCDTHLSSSSSESAPPSSVVGNNLPTVLQPERAAMGLDNPPDDSQADLPSSRLDSESDRNGENSWASSVIATPTHDDTLESASAEESAGVSITPAVPTSSDHPIVTGTGSSSQNNRDVGVDSSNPADIASGDLEPSVSILETVQETSIPETATVESCTSGQLHEAGLNVSSRMVKSSELSCKKSTSNHNNPSSASLSGPVKVLSSARALPALAVGYSSGSKQLAKTKGSSVELPPGMGSIHVRAVTITCACPSSKEMARTLATATCDCYTRADGLYWDVVQEKTLTQSMQQQKSREVSEESRSGQSRSGSQRSGRNASHRGGLVTVFLMGAVGACFWFVLCQGVWRVTRQIVRSGVHIVSTTSDL